MGRLSLPRMQNFSFDRIIQAIVQITMIKKDYFEPILSIITDLT